MAKDVFRRVNKEKHLFSNQHKDKHGLWSKRFYAVFTDWQRTTHRDPLGENLQIARDRLGELLTLNGRRFDFKAAKQQREDEAKNAAKTERKEVTCGEFATHYFDALALGLGKAERTIERERGLWSRLEDHFSPM